MSPKEREEMALQISWAKTASTDYFNQGMKSQGPIKREADVSTVSFLARGR